MFAARLVCQLFAGRAAFVTGAMLATAMSATVFV
jgi:uncharacterized membrane protein